MWVQYFLDHRERTDAIEIYRLWKPWATLVLEYRESRSQKAAQEATSFSYMQEWAARLKACGIRLEDANEVSWGEYEATKGIN